MSNYDCRDIQAFSGVMVFCEQREGVMNQTSFELLSEGRKLADDLGVDLWGLLLGSGVEELAKQPGGYGADKVFVVDDPLLEPYTTDAYTKVITEVVKEKRPEILLIGATNLGRDLGPRIAARLHTGLTADATHLDIDTKKYMDFLAEASNLDLTKGKWNMEDKGLKMTRPAFGGHLMATIICPRFRPQMSTVRPGVLACAEFDAAKAETVTVEPLKVPLAESDIRAKVLEVVKETKEIVDLIGAEVIVSVGGGISKDVEGGLKLAEELAEAFGGGVVGASRAVVDAGWLPSDRQVGQTGKTVRPRIYVALGISGAIQHKAGMQDSEYIIAVNSNPDAPIFEAADYAISGDLYKVVPLMIEALKEV
ncbi:MAG: electron transfer flavoprotein subunit alpha/FixB family protein [Clostridia bacterium]|nr:electron transfer flavoprotein subunit alpha/FixB family protein [Clostridia bacterium]